ncbi:ATP-binding protein [Thermococcus sp. SY098]|uniref:ATP-binding protein n=1 Tax=Thermococcus sp. SY098 TaxID=3111325 RepID=UPI002D76AF5F|nr:ATP-binding protein [Thermococcus sp. SY098]WRS52180.1 ATP-binding protein [Thermococcus sp. SY098]
MEELIGFQNPWWQNKKAIYEDEKVKEALSKKNPIRYTFENRNKIIVGPRQVGKTTYLKLTILDLIEKGISPRSILYFSCDLFKDYRDIVDILRFFSRMQRGEKFVFLDEVTFVEGWERAIKFFLDSPLKKDTTLYITGSSSLGLKKESFPGRPIKVEEFLPLSFRQVVELLNPKLKKELGKITLENYPKAFYENALRLYPFMDELFEAFYFYLSSGGYPKSIFELLEGGEISPNTYEIIYNATIFDVTKLGRSERIALSIILGILKRYGEKFSLNALSKEMEIGSHVTVREYLEIFEELFIGRNYFQTKPNLMTPLFRKERKFYFLDPLILETFSRKFGIEVEIAKKVEGIVGEHIKRNFDTYFFHNTKEVDFVTRDFGIEVKWQNKVKPSDFPRVGIKNKILLSKGKLDFIEERNLAIIPVPLFLVQL